MRTFTLSAERLQAIRNELDLTQVDFADVLGVGERTFIRWERGEQAIPSCAARLVWFLRGYGIPKQWL